MKKMNLTIGGLPMRRSLGFYVGVIDEQPIRLTHGTRGLYRWWVQKLHGSEMLGRGQTATEAIEAAREWLKRPLSTRFIVGGDDTTAYSLRDMLATNKDDPDLCEWMKTAKPGDKFINGAGCECIAGLPESWKEAA